MRFPGSAVEIELSLSDVHDDPVMKNHAASHARDETAIP